MSSTPKEEFDQATAILESIGQILEQVPGTYAEHNSRKEALKLLHTQIQGYYLLRIKNNEDS